jgi:hypothetical protein
MISKNRNIVESMERQTPKERPAFEMPINLFQPLTPLFNPEKFRKRPWVDSFSGRGHGHVYPNPNGVKLRCGGPGLCPSCTEDLEDLRRDIGLS